MPELPEVEIARRQLDRWATGRGIDRVIVRDDAAIRGRLSSAPSERSADGLRRIVEATGAVADRPIRHGKRLGWPLGDVGLLVHLGMTGSWARGPEPSHARLGFEVDGAWIWLVDPRRFGCVVVVERGQLEAALREGLGPDALDEAVDAEGLRRAFGRRGPIKPALLDQARLAGVGNIYATEALWRAGVAPHRAGAELTPAEWARLADAIPAVLAGAIARDDGDELVYVNLGGENPFAIYGREGAPCPRCGTAIVRTILGGRGTFSCPACQPT